MRKIALIIVVILLFSLGCGHSDSAPEDGPPAGEGAPVEETPATEGDDPPEDGQPVEGEDPEEASPGEVAEGEPVPVDTGPDSGLPPNELGYVPVLMYHHLGPEESTWTRTPENFRGDMEFLYDRGYRPVSMAEYVSGEMDLPRGTSPVVITFDDGLASQLRWGEGGVGDPDPSCAVGIMLDFAAEHPGFEARAIFYLNSPRPFHPLPSEDIPATLAWLVENGFELGSHTHYHADFREVRDETEVQRVIALPQKMVEEAVPGYRIESFALPYGLWPSNRELAYAGSYEGIEYRHDSVVLVGAQPAPSPFSGAFDPLATPRIRASQDQWDLWFEELDGGGRGRYVSDGDPTTIAAPESSMQRLSPGAVGDRDVVIIDVEDE